MKNTYLACADKHNGRYYGYVGILRKNKSLMACHLDRGHAYLAPDGEVRAECVLALVCESKREAREIVTKWNRDWYLDGVFGIDEDDIKFGTSETRLYEKHL